jgi:predicted flap endonuclease-1-like 5' DNA nuclease
MANPLSFQGVALDNAYQGLASAGVHADVAKEIIGIWVGEAVKRGRRFGYSQDFPAKDADCEPAPFKRSFEHKDWVDGESIVQAQESPSEKGFNDRFHKIEHDLDALGSLAAKAFTCQAEMRAGLAEALSQIAAELNRLNADVTELRKGSSLPPFSSPVNKGLQFIGKTNYFGKQMMVWQDPEGRLVNLPDPSAVTLPPAADPRGPKVAEVFGRDDDIRKAFTGAVTKKDIVEKFGDRISQDGTRLGDALASIPDDQAFPNLDAVVTKLADQDAALITGLGGESALRSSVGVAAGEAVSSAEVGRVAGVTPEIAKVLEDAGVKTVADLNTVTPEHIMEVSHASGVAMDAGRAARIATMGRVLGRFG